MGGCFAFWYDKLGGSIGERSCRSCGSDGWNERRFNLYQTFHYFVEEDQIHVFMPIANAWVAGTESVV